jgi:aminopeptidase N
MPFPFSKYDLLFVPEFSSSAMENPGLVVYHDDIMRDVLGAIDVRMYSLNTHLHELAHMWIGNIATLKWWDDVWINESFAEGLSYIAMEKMRVETPERIRDLFSQRKRWGYQCDNDPHAPSPIAGQ